MLSKVRVHAPRVSHALLGVVCQLAFAVVIFGSPAAPCATLDISNVNPPPGTTLEIEIESGVVTFLDTISLRAHWSFAANESLLPIYSGLEFWYADSSDWSEPMDDAFHEPETRSGSYDFVGLPQKSIEGITKTPVKVRFGIVTLGAWNTPVVRYTGEYFVRVGPPPATITVVRPTGTETWDTGTTETVRWTYTGDPGPSVRIELLTGTTVDSVIAANAPPGSSGSGSFGWNVPDSLPAGQYKVRITSNTDLSVSHTSRWFTIRAQGRPRLSVTPESLAVGPAGGIRSFAVENAGQGTMNWTANVLSEARSWLRITEGAEGVDSGAVSVNYDENTTGEERTGTVQVWAPGAESPLARVTLVQAASPAGEEGKVLGVIVGVSDSPNNINAGADAQGMWDRLSELEAWAPDASSLIVLDLNTMKADELWEALTAGVKKADDFIFRRNNPNDFFILFYSGHGAFPDEDADQGESSHCYYVTDACNERATDDYWPAVGRDITDDALSRLFIVPGAGPADVAPGASWANVSKLFLFDCAYALGWWGEDDGEHDLDLQRLGPKTAFIGSTDETRPALVSRDAGINGRGVFSVALERALTRNADGLLTGDGNKSGKLTFWELVSAIAAEADLLLPNPGRTIGLKVIPAQDVPYDGQSEHTFASGAEFEMYVDTEEKAPPVTTYLTAPLAVQASDGVFTDKVRVTWLPVPDAMQYQVYRSVSTLPYSETPISGWFPDTHFDDFSAYQPTVKSAGCAGKQVTPHYYWYWVKARNIDGEGPLSACDRGHRGSWGLSEDMAETLEDTVWDWFNQWLEASALLEEKALGGASGTAVSPTTTYEPVMPAAKLSDTVYCAQPSSPLALRLRSAEAIDTASVWGRVACDGFESSDAVWVPIDTHDLRDGWVVYRPQAQWDTGTVIAMTAGATTVSGAVIGPVTRVFQIQSASCIGVVEEDVWQPDTDLGDPVLASLAVLDDGVPVAPGGVGQIYLVGPQKVFETPARVWLPVPPGLDPDTAQVVYYHANGADRGWYLADRVEGWLVPDSYAIAEVNGTAYFGFLVNHGGIVQLAPPQPVDALAPASASVLPTDLLGRDSMGDLLLMALAAASLLFVGKRTAPDHQKR